MSVFISYAHSDREFVDKLAAKLVKAKTPVWLDRWELNVGDSLVRRVEAAVTGAAALVVVLSKASVASEWCRKELSVGLIRELDERRVVVLPVLIDDCEVPLFLRDKKYADFRTDFDNGFADLLKALAFITNDARSRIESPEWHTDWAMDWGIAFDRAFFRATFVEQAINNPYSCLVTVDVSGSAAATDRFLAYSQAGLEHVYRLIVFSALTDVATEMDLRVLLENQFPHQLEFGIRDARLGIDWTAQVECRLLGEDTGADVLLNIAGMLKGAVSHMTIAAARVTPSEQARLDALLAQLE